MSQKETKGSERNSSFNLILSPPYSLHLVMTFLNNYTAPEPLAISNYHSDTPLESYDLNHCYPFTLNVNDGGLSSDGGVKLYPLIPSIHAERLFKLFEPHPESYRWLPYGPFTKSYSKFLTFLETCRRDPQTLLFVVYDLSLDFEQQEDFSLEGGKGLNSSRIAGIVGILKVIPKTVQPKSVIYTSLLRFKKLTC